MNAPRRPPSLLASALEPLAAALWILFLLWSGLVAVVWTLGIGSVELGEAVSNPGLRDALLVGLNLLDPVWITLAAIQVYRGLIALCGLDGARMRALAVFGAVMAIALMSVRCGFPLGPIRYTSRLGTRLGPVPVGLPLLWLALIFSAHAGLQARFPRLGAWKLAAAVGGLCALTAFNLEPLAWKTRSWWLWQAADPHIPGTPPLWSALVWLPIGAGVCWLLMRDQKPRTPSPATRQMASVILILNGVFLLAHAARLLHR